MKATSPKLWVVLFSLTAVASLGAAQSEAYWQPGTGAQVGGVYFHVVSVGPDSEALFRVSQRLEAPGVEEHPDCYRVSRTYYHRESCPVLQEHFRRHAAAASTTAPTTARASRSGGSHPINYLEGNYRRPSAPYWTSVGLWYTPWFGAGHRFGGRPAHRPGFRPPHSSFRRGGFHGGGFRGGVSFRFWR